MFELQTTYKASLQYVKVNNDYLINSDQQNIILYLISQNISETKALTELKKKTKKKHTLFQHLKFEFHYPSLQHCG